MRWSGLRDVVRRPERVLRNGGRMATGNPGV